MRDRSRHRVAYPASHRLLSIGAPSVVSGFSPRRAVSRPRSTHSHLETISGYHPSSWSRSQYQRRACPGEKPSAALGGTAGDSVTFDGQFSLGQGRGTEEGDQLGARARPWSGQHRLQRPANELGLLSIRPQSAREPLDERRVSSRSRDLDTPSAAGGAPLLVMGNTRRIAGLQFLGFHDTHLIRLRFRIAGDGCRYVNRNAPPYAPGTAGESDAAHAPTTRSGPRR